MSTGQTWLKIIGLETIQQNLNEHGSIWGPTKYCFRKEFILFNSVRVKMEWRSSNNVMGRFGGGWDWKLGWQGGGSSHIFSFLVFTISFYGIRK